MTKYMINEQYDVAEAEVSKSFGKGEKREDYADAWKDTGNVILVGLPGSGKMALSELIGERSGMEVVVPESNETAIEFLNGKGRVIVLDDGLVEDQRVYSLIHGAGKVFYLMTDSNTLSSRVAECEAIEDKEQLWRDLSSRLGVMEPLFYGTLHFILQATQSPEEMADDAMEKVAY